jgi:glyoxylase-like metal-dependent hydrolase (beta-lactamase superfamily II)
MIFKDFAEIKPNIFLVDIHQMGMKHIASSFIFWDGTDCVIMDVGTSDDLLNLRRVLKKLEIPLEKIRCEVNTHYHFDHGGGSLALWNYIQKKSADPKNFQIWASQLTHDLIQNAGPHLEGARTTFGDFVGKMDPIPEEGFRIINYDQDLPLDLQNGFSLRLLSTPGHSPDHACPTIYQDGKPYFCFTGESCGTLFHSTKLVSLPTSMPPHFNFDRYIAGVKKIQELHCDCLGFCHMGAITTKEEAETFLAEHYAYMHNWRSKIFSAYAQEPATKYIIENTTEFWQDRFDFGDPSHWLFRNLQLALTYGMMVGLGLRKPKYEQKATKN